ncbi:sigma-70 family RNA polymerase sigma factor [Bacteroides sp. 214]|uniref:RNA polymerase sigma factor n=1 Tax=Bacteroides sp. 214 TaxID=2302935 RepID=UPI0013D2C302|nr:sigma-70 family RNA polymerase sigma factor [Bacteroides sp. 214]NDW11697.1 sigma-70 family RNA polymerase sigma factor [Bacteroides sp. 214]
MEICTSMTDEALVVLYAKGENKAFDILLNRHKNKLYSYIYYLVQDADLAEDIFQETFMKAIVTIRKGKYNENGKFPAWISRIAHNMIIDHFRQEKNNNVVTGDISDMGLLNSIVFAEKAIEHSIINDQILGDVRKLIDYLPDEQREVVWMRFYQDLSFKEIAEATGVSINTSLGRMRYAIINLRRMAEKSGVVLMD